MRPGTSARRPAADPQRLRRARMGAALLFLVNGAVFANLLPRLPQIKDAFELSNTAYGFVVIAFPLGSLLAGTAPAPILRCWGSGRTAVAGSVAIAVMITLAGVSGGIGGGLLVLLAYLVSLMLAGMLDAITDTAQNAQALEVQRRMGRSILNSMHALWSLGSVIGGLMGTAALALHVPLGIHLLCSGAIFTAVALMAGTRVLTADEVAALRTVPAGEAAAGTEGSAGTVGPAAGAASAGRGTSASARRAVGMLVLITLVAITGVMVEDLGQNWSALYLRQVLDSPATIAGLGLVALMCAQFLGRLMGDRMVDRFGHAAMARCGAAGIAVGIALVVIAPVSGVAIPGFFLAGLGSATLVPSAYHAADLVPGLRPGTGLTVVSWLMRGAFLSLSPFVGAVSDVVGLRLALLIIPVMAVLALLAAGRLRQPAPA